MIALRTVLIVALALVAAFLACAVGFSLWMGDGPAACLFGACLVLVALPTRYDPAIILKERSLHDSQGG